MPVTPEQLRAALGNPHVQELATKFGIPTDQVLKLLADIAGSDRSGKPERHDQVVTAPSSLLALSGRCNYASVCPSLAQQPVLDGYEATRRIKPDPALRSIPIIAVTSYALSGDEQKAREASCDDFVPKPYSPRQLLAKIRQYLP